jgi:hypothetical protein
VDQLHHFADARLLLGCIYCGGNESTRDHVPSKLFLDTPYPENLPVIGACRPCNNGFSKDEEYLACLIEAAVSGSTDPSAVRRSRIAKIFARSPELRMRIEAAKATTQSGVSFYPEAVRVERVLVKLATGHAAYELAQECRDQRASLWWLPIHLLSQEQREEFEAPDVVTTLGEIGSRGMLRLRVADIKLVSHAGAEINQQFYLHDWVEVQPQRYRYLASDQGRTVCIRIVIGEYLAAEVYWQI